MLSSLFTPTDRITAPIWLLTSCCFLFSLENKIQGFINFFTWKKLISSLKQAQHPFPAENLRIEGAKCHPNYFTLQPTYSKLDDITPTHPGENEELVQCCMTRMETTLLL